MRAEIPDDTAANLDTAPAAPRLHILINPGAGGHDLQQTREMLARVFGESGRPYDFVPIARPADLAAVSAGTAARAGRSGSVVVAVGGDGTINTVAQAAWKEGCTLGILPQGTFNMFARDHGIPLDLETAARALLAARPEPVQVGEINGRLFLVNASLGLYPQLLQDREAFKKQFGRHRWVAVVSALLTLFRWRRQLALEVELNGQRTLLRTPTLFVCNNRLQLERVGVEAEVASQVGEGRLVAVAASPIGTWTMAWLLLRGAFGRLGEAQQVRSFACRSLAVRVLGRRRVKVAADGEVSAMSPLLRFAVAVRPLTLMLPRPEDRAPAE
jgi:diacylglycerol kinase family enzyme